MVRKMSQVSVLIIELSNGEINYFAPRIFDIDTKPVVKQTIVMADNCQSNLEPNYIRKSITIQNKSIEDGNDFKGKPKNESIESLFEFKELKQQCFPMTEIDQHPIDTCDLKEKPNINNSKPLPMAGKTSTPAGNLQINKKSYLKKQCFSTDELLRSTKKQHRYSVDASNLKNTDNNYDLNPFLVLKKTLTPLGVKSSKSLRTTKGLPKKQLFPTDNFLCSPNKKLKTSSVQPSKKIDKKKTLKNDSYLNNSIERLEKSIDLATQKLNVQKISDVQETSNVRLCHNILLDKFEAMDQSSIKLHKLKQQYPHYQYESGKKYHEEIIKNSTWLHLEITPLSNDILKQYLK